MMVISVCVNVLLFKSCFGSSCDSHHLLLLVVISLLQRYKTDFSTSIGWYINIISVNEITVFNCKFKLKCCYRIFYGRIPATTVFYRKLCRFLFFTLQCV